MFQVQFESVELSPESDHTVYQNPAQPVHGVWINKEKAKFKREIDKCDPKHDMTAFRGSVLALGQSTQGIGKSGETEHGNETVALYRAVLQAESES
jgi:hypothetical protein